MRVPVPTENQLDDASDYELIGGEEAVEALVDRLCQLLQEDHQLVDLLGATDTRQLRRHQSLLVSQALGGPQCVDDRTLERAHRPRRIGRDAYRKVTSYVVQTLVEIGAKPAIIGRVGAALAAMERDVVTVGAW